MMMTTSSRFNATRSVIRAPITANHKPAPRIMTTPTNRLKFLRGVPTSLV